MKPIKKSTKKSTKVFKADFTIDITDAKTEIDVYCAILEQKVMNGIQLTTEEVKSLVVYTALDFVDSLFGDDCKLLLKTDNGYKRIASIYVNEKPTLWQRIKRFFKR